MNRVCLGCGVPFQSTSKEKKGFVVAEKMEQAVYCERCYRLKHYHEIHFCSLDFDNQQIVDFVQKKHIPVYYFLDLINLNQESLAYFKQIKGSKILVLTKMDLIPKTISFERMVERIRFLYQISEEILCLSAKNKKMVATLWNHIIRSGNKKVAFLGMTNVGKSTLLNELSRYVLNKDAEVLISEMPNTTQNFLEWNILDQIILDAPGFNYKTSFDFSWYCKAVPKKYFRPITEQMKKETVLLFEDLFHISQDQKQNSITFYGSNEFQLKKIYRNHSDFTFQESILVPEHSDVVLPGIGFFSVKKSCQILFSSKVKIPFEIRMNLFGGHDDSN